MRILITGANGHLGLRLINALAALHEVVAVVRSEKALTTIAGLQCQGQIVDYADSDGLAAAARDCESAVHLVGIIKKTRINTYEQAHEIPCAALASAAAKAGLQQIIAMSIVGSDSNSSNECFASRGRAEDILIDGPVPATIIRVPMVLGESDYASRALLQKANRSIGFSLRTASLEQPIYAGDVINAILAAINAPFLNEIIELAGPEVLTRGELISRAAGVIGKSPIIISVPVAVGRVIARVFESLMSFPPVTEDMIDLLDHDDDVASDVSARKIGIELTSLDVMLNKVMMQP